MYEELLEEIYRGAFMYRDDRDSAAERYVRPYKGIGSFAARELSRIQSGDP